MGVTLYRCQKCRGLFNAVFEPMKLCRDCKLNQFSGGTSKGAGDLSHAIVSKLGKPGVLVHGVALKDWLDRRKAERSRRCAQSHLNLFRPHGEARS